MHSIRGLSIIVKALIAASSIVAATVSATPLGGSTVTTDADLGLSFIEVGGDTCKSGDNSALVGAGLELSGSHYTGECKGYVTVDVSDSQIVVGGVREIRDGQLVGDYTWMTVVLNFVGAGSITSVSLLSQDLFLSGFFDVPNPTIWFDVDTIGLTWSSIGSSIGYFELANGGSAVFSVGGTSVPVPEPGTLALLGFGLLGLGLARRKAS